MATMPFPVVPPRSMPPPVVPSCSGMQSSSTPTSLPSPPSSQTPAAALQSFKRSLPAPPSRSIQRPAGVRVLVHGLPPDADEEEVRSVFKAEGFVTAVSFDIKSPTGPAAKSAEVSYSSKQGVEGALKRLDGIGLRGNILKVVREGAAPTRGMPY